MTIVAHGGGGATESTCCFCFGLGKLIDECKQTPSSCHTFACSHCKHHEMLRTRTEFIAKPAGEASNCFFPQLSMPEEASFDQRYQSLQPPAC